MQDDQLIRHIDPDDQIDASAADKARSDTEPDLNAVRDAGSDADQDETVGSDAHAQGGSDDACRCDDIEKAIIAHLDVVEGPAGCRMAALVRVLAKECCDDSSSSAEALAIGSRIIKAFKVKVEEIICSDEYGKRTGAGATVLDVDLSSTILAAIIGAALSGRSKN